MPRWPPPSESKPCARRRRRTAHWRARNACRAAGCGRRAAGRRRCARGRRAGAGSPYDRSCCTTCSTFRSATLPRWSAEDQRRCGSSPRGPAATSSARVRASRPRAMSTIAPYELSDRRSPRATSRASRGSRSAAGPRANQSRSSSTGGLDWCSRAGTASALRSHSSSTTAVSPASTQSAIRRNCDASDYRPLDRRIPSLIVCACPIALRG